MGVESNAKQNLDNFSKSIIEYGTGFSLETSFASFQAALEYVFKMAENERIVLAIDEYPYVARSSKSLASTLQLLIDKYKDTSKLMLILDMLAGRLEIFPMLILFSPSTWRHR